MKRYALSVLCGLLLTGQPVDLRAAQAKPTTEPVAADISVSVNLTAGDPDSKLAPRYSPPGKRLKLEPLATGETPEELGFEGLQTEVVLGAPVDQQSPLKLLVTRTSPEAAYTRLFIDRNGNGKFDEPAILAKESNTRGKIWSNFEATLQVSYLGEQTITEDYPVAFWLTVEDAAELPVALLISRRGFKSGEAEVDGQTVSVILSDSNNDAVFGAGDWWELRSDKTEAKGNGNGNGNAMRRVGDFAWLGESAFQLKVDNPYGGSVNLIPFDPGLTREEDEHARDPYAADRVAVKAEQPLSFRLDVDTAIAEAEEQNLPCFLKFETTWCGPCKTMTQYVFTAKDVVEAAEGVICVKVDGDERKDLTERFKVTGYPTGVMLAPDGTEAARFVGYQQVTQMSKFLKDKRKSP